MSYRCALLGCSTVVQCMESFCPLCQLTAVNHVPAHLRHVMILQTHTQQQELHYWCMRYPTSLLIQAPLESLSPPLALIRSAKPQWSFMLVSQESAGYRQSLGPISAIGPNLSLPHRQPRFGSYPALSFLNKTSISRFTYMGLL